MIQEDFPSFIMVQKAIFIDNDEMRRHIGKKYPPKKFQQCENKVIQHKTSYL